MKLAVMFNGQGAHYQGMGYDFYQQFPKSKEVFDEAEKVTGQPVLNWINEEFEKLSKTQFAQLAIAATSLAIYRSIEDQLPEVVAMGGLSLGEYSALMASNTLAQVDGWKLLQERGQLMSEQCSVIDNCQMIAAIDIPEEVIESLIKEFKLANQLYIANYNSPKQLVLAGTAEAISIFKTEAKALGYKKVLPLKVEGPFHSPFMADIKARFNKVLEAYQFSVDKKIPVWSNVNVKAHGNETISTLLTEHLVKPVYWYQTIDQWVAEGVTHIIQIGPGNTLSKLLAGHHPEIQSIVIDKVEDVQQISQFIKE